MLNGILRPAKRPDRGNLLKFYEDCLTGIVWVDDSQVVDGAVRKIFAEVPRTVIRVLPIAQYTLGHIPEAKHVVD